MKLILFFVVSCLAFQKGNGAPRNAVYKFVKCNPEGSQANCVTQKSPPMPWSPDLPTKLPASTGQYMEAEPEEDENPLWEGEVDFVMDEDVKPNGSEDGELPVKAGEGSGGFEGSADGLVEDWATGETGSGESWAEKDGKQYKVGGMTGMRRLLPSKSVIAEAKPAEHEMREDHLLQL
ncbi:serglycin isoform X2 [Pungitius pungitius]|uniref:serglycin isoform X2 n=1 Tax=Pungitius pungitius TaxID=134920 RepID=UPI002E1264E1